MLNTLESLLVHMHNRSGISLRRQTLDVLLKLPCEQVTPARAHASSLSACRLLIMTAGQLVLVIFPCRKQAGLHCAAGRLPVMTASQLVLVGSLFGSWQTLYCAIKDHVR